MKKKYLYSLLTTYIATLGGLSSCSPQPQTHDNAGQNKVKKIYVYKTPTLTTRVDTLNITNTNFEHIKKTATGALFVVKSNTIILHYFQAQSDSLPVINFCKRNNNLRQLYLRHENEHAIKQDLVYNTETFSQFACGEISAADEVSARIAEIIEFTDYYAATGIRLPHKTFVAHADSAINSTRKAPTPGYVNFEHQPVADAVITYALEGYLDAVKRGFYKNVILNAYNRKRFKKPQFLTPCQFFSFNPDMNKWDPMWEFESISGKCNPYRHASFATRQKLIQTLDSLVSDVTGADKFTEFYKSIKSR